MKAGRTFASNGPLLGLEIDGKHPGDTVARSAPGKLHYRIALRSPVAVEHLELVQNGKVVKSFALTGDRRKLDAEGELRADAGGWLLLRAWNEGADPQVLDLYPYATTSPVYLELQGGAPAAPDDAAYFVAWLDRVIADAGSRTDYRTDRERGSAPAEEFLVDGGPATVGIIASVTRPFCGDCDRVRLTADGQVRNCLFAREESDLRAALRGGAPDTEIADRWRAALWTKLPGHGIDDVDFLQPSRPMSAIGG